MLPFILIISYIAFYYSYGGNTVYDLTLWYVLFNLFYNLHFNVNEHINIFIYYFKNSYLGKQLTKFYYYLSGKIFNFILRKFILKIGKSDDYIQKNNVTTTLKTKDEINNFLDNILKKN
jgi:hypothetical protein